ncbi:hypothetical protein LOK49_LG08G02904 [Camellia lanceoleosa]|uniref:Uncharacterized protein n=1 Tax=Camellia lanceoleosa TaxID=1840588 RepID=A0ACC0GVR3_9ERIC|nr:hypothetical protein LOK49_LG08G02904 [Camellia lanceoleosa]
MFSLLESNIHCLWPNKGMNSEKCSNNKQTTARQEEYAENEDKRGGKKEMNSISQPIGQRHGGNSDTDHLFLLPQLSSHQIDIDPQGLPTPKVSNSCLYLLVCYSIFILFFSNLLVCKSDASEATSYHTLNYLIKFLPFNVIQGFDVSRDSIVIRAHCQYHLCSPFPMCIDRIVSFLPMYPCLVPKWHKKESYDEVRLLSRTSKGVCSLGSKLIVLINSPYVVSGNGGDKHLSRDIAREQE